MSTSTILVTCLRLAGASMVGLSLLHFDFSRRFRWREDLSPLSLLNREIFYVHTFFVCLTVAGMGAICFFDPRALLEPTRLGRWAAAGGAVFWAARLYVQFFVYSSSHWRGRRFESWVHAAFILLWTFYTTAFGACLACQLGWRLM